MTKQEADFIGSMNMCDEISNEAYKKIMCNCKVEEEECEDCISREDAIKIIKEHPSIVGNRSTIVQKIVDLPSVTPKTVTDFADKCQECGKILNDKLQTSWIPVTEDAPPKGTICLWCNKQGSVFTSEITYRSERISYVGKHGYFHNGLENYGDIIAWMPLPQPYTESEGEEVKADEN